MAWVQRQGTTSAQVGKLRHRASMVGFEQGAPSKTQHLSAASCRCSGLLLRFPGLWVYTRAGSGTQQPHFLIGLWAFP